MTPPEDRQGLGRQGFGTMRLREDPRAPGDGPVAVIHAALDAGITMIDTAELYENEELVGRAVRPRRDEVLLASKFGVAVGEDLPGGYEVRADPESVRRSCDASLRRLGVDRIDLYYLHHRSDTVPVEDTVGAMSELAAQGKIGALGLSNVTAEDLRRAHAVHPIAALQEAWSLVERTVEEELLPTARRLGVPVVAHSPTGHGVLHAPAGDDGPAGERLGARLDRIARDHDATPGQVALAWVHHRRQVHSTPVVPLPGTSRVDHLRLNVAAAGLALSPDELRLLDAA